MALHNIPYPDDYSMPLIGLHINPRQQWKQKFKEFITLGGRHVDLPAEHEDVNKMVELLKAQAAILRLSRQDFFLSASVGVPGDLGRTVWRVRRLCSLLETSLDLLVMENPQGLQGTKPMEHYDTDADETRPDVRKISHLFRRLPDGSLKVAPNFVQDLGLVWRTLEDEVTAPGFALDLGLRHFNNEQVKEILKGAKQKPRVVQAEINLYSSQPALEELCASSQLSLVATHPMGGPHHKPSKMRPHITCHPRVTQVADRHGVSNETVVIRHLLQSGLRVVFDNTSITNMICVTSNVWRFLLTQGQMNNLGRGRSDALKELVLLTRFEVECLIDPLWPYYFGKEWRSGISNAGKREGCEGEGGTNAEHRSLHWLTQEENTGHQKL